MLLSQSSASYPSLSSTLSAKQSASRSPSPPNERRCSRSPLSLSQNHLFLQSPTHVRSNSGSHPLSSHNRFHRHHHFVSKDALSGSNKNCSSNTNSNPSLTHSLNPPASSFLPEITSASEEIDDGNILSFASGYSLYQQQQYQQLTPTAGAATTIAKPVAIYPQELQPCPKRFSHTVTSSGVSGNGGHVHSSGMSGSSYLSYASALATTIEQLQLQQQQHLQRQQQRKNDQAAQLDRIRSDKNGRATDYITDGGSVHEQQQQQEQQQQEQQQQNKHERSRHRNRSSFNSPPSPCTTASDAFSSPLSLSTCCCSSSSSGPPFSFNHSRSSSYPGIISHKNNNIPSNFVTYPNASSSETTDMSNCSPVLSRILTKTPSPPPATIRLSGETTGAAATSSSSLTQTTATTTTATAANTAAVVTANAQKDKMDKNGNTILSTVHSLDDHVAIGVVQASHTRTPSVIGSAKLLSSRMEDHTNNNDNHHYDPAHRRNSGGDSKNRSKDTGAKNSLENPSSFGLSSSTQSPPFMPLQQRCQQCNLQDSNAASTLSSSTTTISRHPSHQYQCRDAAARRALKCDKHGLDYQGHLASCCCQREMSRQGQSQGQNQGQNQGSNSEEQWLEIMHSQNTHLPALTSPPSSPASSSSSFQSHRRLRPTQQQQQHEVSHGSHYLHHRRHPSSPASFPSASIPASYPLPTFGYTESSSRSSSSRSTRRPKSALGSTAPATSKTRIRGEGVAISDPSPTSPQAIAQGSSRYIVFIWLPLLPLLLLALGGQTSSNFQSPINYI